MPHLWHMMCPSYAFGIRKACLKTDSSSTLKRDKMILLSCNVTKEFKRRPSFSPSVYGISNTAIHDITWWSYLVPKHPCKSLRAPTCSLMTCIYRKREIRNKSVDKCVGYSEPLSSSTEPQNKEQHSFSHLSPEKQMTFVWAVISKIWKISAVLYI